MANEPKNKKIYYACVSRCQHASCVRWIFQKQISANLSLGELINTLFLMHGDGGSLETSAFRSERRSRWLDTQ